MRFSLRFPGPVVAMKPFTGQYIKTKNTPVRLCTEPVTSNNDPKMVKWKDCDSGRNDSNGVTNSADS